MPSRARPFPQATLPHPSRSRQYGSRYRPAPVHLCPGPVDRAFRNAAIWLESGLWGICEPVWGLGRGDAIAISISSPDSFSTGTLEQPTDLCPAVAQTELPLSRRDSLNFTTATADRCLRSGGLYTETQACHVAVLGHSVSSV